MFMKHASLRRRAATTFCLPLLLTVFATNVQSVVIYDYIPIWPDTSSGFIVFDDSVGSGENFENQQAIAVEFQFIEGHPRFVWSAEDTVLFNEFSAIDGVLDGFGGLEESLMFSVDTDDLEEPGFVNFTPLEFRDRSPGIAGGDLATTCTINPTSPGSCGSAIYTSGFGSWAFRSTSVPEPMTATLLALGLSGAWFARRRRKTF